MNKSILAGAAFLATATLAMPMLAWSAGDAGPGAPSPSPAASSAAPPQPGWGQQPGHPGGRWMGMRGWRHRMGMMRSPRQMCEQRLARHAAHIAYIASLLDLTSDQRPLYAKVRDAMQAAADKQHQLCATLKPADQRGQETVLDRLDRREQVLQAHLQALQQVEPAMQALYQSLSPAQKAVVDHPFRRG